MSTNTFVTSWLPASAEPSQAPAAPVQSAKAQREAKSRREACLAHRLQNRDGQAMSEIYDQYCRLVYAVVHRVTWDTNIAEDLTQEVFMRIWNGIGGFDPARGSLAVWIATVARNRAIDYIGSVAGRMARETADIDKASNIAVSSGFEADIVNQDSVRALRPALDKLTADQRLVLDLCYSEGLSHLEIAQQINRPLGTVKTWVRSALKTLRSHAKCATLASQNASYARASR